MPLFSVIIPTYDRREFLREAVDSVLVQTIQDFEIIVVDDHAPTPVPPFADPRIKVVRAESNGGVARARNLGVQASTGEILTFLDDDDRWVPERLSFALAALERAPIAICRQSARGKRLLEGYVHDSILDSTTPNLGATAIMRSAWTPLDETYRASEDVVWWLTVSQRHPVATHPEQGLLYRIHNTPRVGYGAEVRIQQSLRLMREYREYFETHPRAAAFRWKRIGLMNLSLERPTEARRAFARALRLHPTPAVAWHLLRSFKP